MDFDEALDYAITNRIRITFQGGFDPLHAEVRRVCTFRNGDLYTSFDAKILQDSFVSAFISSMTAIKKEADAIKKEADGL